VGEVTRVLVVFLAACASPDALGPLRTCPVDPPDRAVLHADGTDLRDASDRLVTLRGINTGGRAKFAPYPPAANSATACSTSAPQPAAAS
jgi:hypothetical protein